MGDKGAATAGFADPEGVRTGCSLVGSVLGKKLPVLAGVGGGGVWTVVVGVEAGLGSLSTDKTFSKPSIPMIFSRILLTYVDSYKIMQISSVR